MKLNPFSKASSPYYDKLKNEYGKLNDELSVLKTQLGFAKADEARERAIYEKVCESAQNMTEAKVRQHEILSECANISNDIESKISQLELRITPLRQIVEAPELYTSAKKTLKDLLTRKGSLSGDLEKTDAMLVKVGARIIDLETRITTETASAAQGLLKEESKFVVPEALIKLDLELRLNKASQGDLQSKREALVVELHELPNAIKEAKFAYLAYRSTIAEIELRDQLIPIMDLFARASVARHRWSSHYNERLYEIEISPELIASADAALSAEMPAD